MSFRVLVIPEDPTYNGSILDPLARQLLRNAGRPNAAVTVLSKPRTRGFDNAHKLLPKIIEQYAHFDLFLLMVDSDGIDRAPRFTELERRYPKLLCCAAVPEVEVWLLAAFARDLDESWANVRGEVRLKETHFRTFLDRKGDRRLPDEGRRALMESAVKRLPSILKKCPELADLTKRLRSWLRSR